MTPVKQKYVLNSKKHILRICEVYSGVPKVIPHVLLIKRPTSVFL